MPDRRRDNVIVFPRRLRPVTRPPVQSTAASPPRSIKVDRYGSPVTFKAASWLVLFVPGLQKQWWHPFVNRRHKHVFAMRPALNGRWILFEPWWGRLLTASVSTEQARKYLLWGSRGDALLVKEAVPGQSSQIRGWMTCAGLVSHLLGRRYWVWTPHGFYNSLRQENGVRVVDMAALLSTDLGAMAMRRLELGGLAK